MFLKDSNFVTDSKKNKIFLKDLSKGDEIVAFDVNKNGVMKIKNVEVRDIEYFNEKANIVNFSNDTQLILFENQFIYTENGWKNKIKPGMMVYNMNNELIEVLKVSKTFKTQKKHKITILDAKGYFLNEIAVGDLLKDY